MNGKWFIFSTHSLWPSDVMWCHRTWSLLIQVIDYCLRQCFKIIFSLSHPEMFRKFPYIIYYNFYLPRVKFNWSSPIFGRQGRLGDPLVLNIASGHQALTLTNIDLTSVRSCGIHIGAMSEEMLKISIRDRSLKLLTLKMINSWLQLQLSGTNELRHFWLGYFFIFRGWRCCPTTLPRHHGEQIRLSVPQRDLSLSGHQQSSKARQIWFSYRHTHRSISWPLMPWLHKEPGYQLPWYWLVQSGYYGFQ